MVQQVWKCKQNDNDIEFKNSLSVYINSYIMKDYGTWIRFPILFNWENFTIIDIMQVDTELHASQCILDIEPFRDQQTDLAILMKL